MKPWIANFRRERPPRTAPKAPRKRPGRSFAAALASLEPRALLTLIVPAAVPAASPTADLFIVGSSTGVAATAPDPADGQAPGTPEDVVGGTFIPPADGSSTGPAGGTSQDSPQAGSPAAHDDRDANRVSLSEANLTVGGVPTPEFALANAGDDKVIVRVGFGPKTAVLDASDGIDDPKSVALSDLSGDGIPDLIVVNSGDDDVLVFPGLPGGRFGPEVDGGRGIPVGNDPVSVTVDDDNGDRVPSLIVSNEGSNTVTILGGQVVGGQWAATMASTFDVGQGPVKTALYDYNNDGQPDLFVCNSESDTVAMYPGQPGGTFSLADPTFFDVGMTPSDLFVGQFDNRPQPDLVTVNSGSNNVTFIGGIFTGQPTTQSYSSGGTMPDAAFAFAADPGHGRMMDLVVANSGDGRLALLQAANDGMQLAGVISQSDMPVPTGLAPATLSGGGLDFLAASAGQDAALLLHFDLGVASTYLANPSDGSGQQGGDDDELVAELMPFGESALGMIAVFWAGSPDSSADSGEWGLREPSTITALYSPTEGQGSDGDDASPEAASPIPDPPAPPPELSAADSPDCFRFVAGIEEALSRPRVPIEVVAARDAPEPGEVRTIGVAGRDESGPSVVPEGPDDASNLVDEALHLLWSGGRPVDGPQPVEIDRRPDPAPPPEGIDAPAPESRRETTVPLISTALLSSARLILKASPPRPPASRKSTARRGFLGLGDARPPGHGRPGRP